SCEEPVVWSTGSWSWSTGRAAPPPGSPPRGSGSNLSSRCRSSEGPVRERGRSRGRYSTVRRPARGGPGLREGVLRHALVGWRPHARPLRGRLPLGDGPRRPPRERGTSGRMVDGLPPRGPGGPGVRGPLPRVPGPPAARVRGAREPPAGRVHGPPPRRHAPQNAVPLLGRGDQRAGPVRPRSALRPRRARPDREEAPPARPGGRGVRPHLLPSAPPGPERGTSVPRALGSRRRMAFRGPGDGPQLGAGHRARKGARVREPGRGPTRAEPSRGHLPLLPTPALASGFEERPTGSARGTRTTGSSPRPPLLRTARRLSGAPGARPCREDRVQVRGPFPRLPAEPGAFSRPVPRAGRAGDPRRILDRSGGRRARGPRSSEGVSRRRRAPRRPGPLPLPRTYPPLGRPPPVRHGRNPPRRPRSARAIAVTASRTTTARGTMQGSCRPATLRVAGERSARFTVRCALAMDDVGLTATRKTTGMPVERPPRIPPALLVSVRTFPWTQTNGSLCSLPFMRAARNPAPNSIAFTAGTERAMCAIELSTESKNGSPRPTGRPSARTSMIPPRLSPSRRASAIASSIRRAASRSGHPTSFVRERSRTAETGSPSQISASTGPIDRVYPTTSTPRAERRVVAI